MKTSKKIISLLLSAAIIMSAMVITAVSAAAQQTAQTYILIIRFLIGKMFIFMPMAQKKMPNGRVS